MHILEIDTIPLHAVRTWLEEVVHLCTPHRIVLCDGSEKETLLANAVQEGRAYPLQRPNSYAFFSDPRDVARVEARTWICTEEEEEAGPTNNWCAPAKMYQQLQHHFQGAMVGQTLYVVPFCMGSLDSPFARFGIQVTNAPYVVLMMEKMTRMGPDVWQKILEGTPFTQCWHATGGDPTAQWPCDPDNVIVAHFPQSNAVWSYGSGYGGNAILGKKSLALRLASYQAHKEGWLAEHMLTIGVTSPEGVKKYFAAAFPSACGKTNLAMLQSQLPGWKVSCIGDDIAWIRFDATGRAWSVNPEVGVFGVAPGVSHHSNPAITTMIAAQSYFTNVALTEQDDVWWEGMGERPDNLRTWDGTTNGPAAHPNARFTVALERCPVLDTQWCNPEGVPLDGIIFGGRRDHLMPLVFQAHDWDHGVLLGASLASQQTAAAEGSLGAVRRDPFAMLPFCGYNIGDYFAHWLKFASPNAPKIFHVNWFRKGKDGAFLWPGFSENMHVLQWIFRRCEANVEAQASPLGWLPFWKDIACDGCTLSHEQRTELLAVHPHEWLEEMQLLRNYFKILGNRVPEKLFTLLAEQQSRFTKGSTL